MKFIFCLLLFSGCQTPSPNDAKWQCNHLPTKKTPSSSRLTYRTHDQVRGIDLEFLHINNDLITYLQVHSRDIVPSVENKSQTKVTIVSPNQKISFLCDFHHGKQRVRLSSAAQAKLLFLLQEEETITISLLGYEESITPEHFEKLFKRLTKAPYRIPFHLPI